MNLPRIQALIAPLATPVAPALLLGNEMYRVMLLVDVDNWIALIAAIVAVVGLEFSGALTSYMAVKAWKRREWGAMTLAIFGALIYAAVVFGGIMIMPEQRAQVFGVAVLVTMVSYLGYGLYHSFQDATDERRDEKMLDLEALRQQRLLVNAQARLAEKQSQLDIVQPSTGQNGQTDTAPEVTDIGQKVIDYFKANPGAPLREVSGEVGCSPETVRKWKAYS